jgi:hypothetical protein
MGMGFLRKSREQTKRIVAVPTKFDEAWFASWEAQVFASTHADTADPENHTALRSRELVLLKFVAHGLMVGNDAAWAYSEFSQYMDQPNATPWDAASLIAGWNAGSILSIEEQLGKGQADIIEIATDRGNLHW